MPLPQAPTSDDCSCLTFRHDRDLLRGMPAFTDARSTGGGAHFVRVDIGMKRLFQPDPVTKGPYKRGPLRRTTGQNSVVVSLADTLAQRFGVSL